MSDKELTTTQDNNFLTIIERLATNPDVDPDKIKQFLDMQEHIMDKNAQQAFNAAMVQAQQEMPVVPKDKKNQQTNSNYSAYETILKHCKPIYTKYGFSISFHEEKSDNKDEIRIAADVMHEQGHTKQYWTDIPIDDKGIKGSVNKTLTHAKGSSISYGRSYLMKMIFNVSTGEDDDGNGASIQYINEVQYNILHSMLSENGLDNERYMQQLLTFLKCSSLEELPAVSFNKAQAAIRAAISKVQR